MLKITNSNFIKSAVYPKDYPPLAFMEVAFVGRSNVGKSSLINLLLNRKSLAKTSNKPGKTRLINFFEVVYKKEDSEKGFFTFVDLPGYGYARVSISEKENWKKMIETYLQKRLNLKLLFFLLDIRHKPSKEDLLMYEILKNNQINFCLIFTKADKVPKNKINFYIKEIKKELGINMETEIAYVSTLKKIGTENRL